MSTFRMRYDKFRLSNRFMFGLLIAVAVSAYALSSGRTRDISQEGNAYNENANATTNEEGQVGLSSLS